MGEGTPGAPTQTSFTVSSQEILTHLTMDNCQKLTIWQLLETWQLFALAVFTLFSQFVRVSSSLCTTLLWVVRLTAENYQVIELWHLPNIKIPEVNACVSTGCSTGSAFHVVCVVSSFCAFPSPPPWSIWDFFSRLLKLKSRRAKQVFTLTATGGSLFCGSKWMVCTKTQFLLPQRGSSREIWGMEIFCILIVVRVPWINACVETH